MAITVKRPPPASENPDVCITLARKGSLPWISSARPLERMVGRDYGRAEPNQLCNPGKLLARTLAPPGGICVPHDLHPRSPVFPAFYNAAFMLDAFLDNVRLVILWKLSRRPRRRKSISVVRM
jgi:hypothetical protein